MKSGVIARLGKNRNGYFGETIDISSVVADCVVAAEKNHWRLEHISKPPEPEIFAFVRPATEAPGPGQASRLYISTGIHGDEPAGPLAVRQLLHDYAWPDCLGLWMCPCLNPAGFRLNRRENGQGLDLNRQYLDPHPNARETVAHIAWLNRQPGFDLSLCLHEDWESHGFYVYELNPDNRPSLAPAILEAVEGVCPIDYSDTIEGRPAKNGLIRPDIDPRSRPDWPEAFFLLTNKTRLSYTLEAPSDYPLTARVAALVRGVKAAVDELAGRAARQ